jgi:alkylation response protein AidB-like acyl-CoA dehydrogenase
MTSPFTDEDAQIVSAVERFVREEVRPAVAKHELEKTYPTHLIDGMREMGLFGMAVPEQYGGLGLRLPVVAAVMEELAKGWTSIAAYVNSHSTVAHVIASHGTEQQKTSYLPKLATGETRAALCLTEAEAGSDLQAIKTTAVKVNDTYTTTGNKIYVTNGEKAELLLVLAKTDPRAEKASKGISLLLVERSWPGVNVGSTFRKMGFDLVDTVEISFENVSVPTSALVGAKEGDGFAQLMNALEAGRIAIAASAVGLAADALGAAMRFAEVRKTFGKTINQHQAIQLRLAEMATKLVAARQITRFAAEEKEMKGRADMVSGMAKLFASEACAEIAKEAILIHGGHGYISEYQVERLMREAVLYLVGEGTNDIQKLVIARRMLDSSDQTVLGVP